MSVDGAVVVEACVLLACFPAELRVSLELGFLRVRSFDIVDVVVKSQCMRGHQQQFVGVYAGSRSCADGLDRRYWGNARKQQ